MADKPKLTTTGQALQTALDTIGRGGERADIQAALDQQIIQANQAGDANTAHALEIVSHNYAISDTEAASVSTTEGWAALGNLQRDIAQGKYNDTTAATPAPAPTPAPVQSPTDIAQNRLAQAVQGGNPQAIQKAEQDLQQAKVGAVQDRQTVVHTTSAPAAPVVAVAPTNDPLTYVQNLHAALNALDGTTITVNTVTSDDELLRRYRAR